MKNCPCSKFFPLSCPSAQATFKHAHEHVNVLPILHVSLMFEQAPELLFCKSHDSTLTKLESVTTATAAQG